MKYFILISTFLFSQIPVNYNLTENQNLNRYTAISTEGLNSNAIIDIMALDSSYLLISTATDLSYIEFNNSSTDSIIFGTFNKNLLSLPRGGLPALTIKNKIIAISGVIDTFTASTGLEQMGTGISYSMDEGINWYYIPQPIDSIPNLGLHHKILWGNQNLSSLAVTTEINNITYDLAITSDYIYATSWAGGLRRYGKLNSSNQNWQIIPLPLDSDTNLLCTNIDTSSYQINPNDPINGGNHNHKGFSVYAVEDTIWVGTANGINKGIISSDCIDWEKHYTSEWNNISGNWVIGFYNQLFDDGSMRLWAITWAGEGHNEHHALSYTDNSGTTWNVTSPSGSSEKVFNLYSYNNRIFAASESGLYISDDGKHWEKNKLNIDTITGERILSNQVYSTYYKDNWTWVGTMDGIGIINNNNTTIHRDWKTANPFNAYPNPFLIDEYNQLDGDGHVRFIYLNIENDNSSIDVFDFSMDKVIHLDNPKTVNSNENEIIWNGRNEYGYQVANGVYFCRLSLKGKYYWTKLAVINSY